MSRNSNKDSNSAILRTILCDLYASEDILRKVWEEMTKKTLL